MSNQTQKYTDLTVITWGAHKGKSLANVPAAWLLWAWDKIYQNKLEPKAPLSVYIFENMEALKKEKK